jgi:hypothetical protein
MRLVRHFYPLSRRLNLCFYRVFEMEFVGLRPRGVYPLPYI